MAKRIRDFRRFSLKAKTGELIREGLVDKTFKDHRLKCHEKVAACEPCSHLESGSLFVAQMVEKGLKTGKKRATLDIPDPYCTEDYVETIRIIKILVERLLSFARHWKKQQGDAGRRLANEILEFAERDPLMVLAEIAAEE